MGWIRRESTERLTEWEDEDGTVTIRARRLPDGRWAVRLDRLFQSAAGPAYRREVVDDEATAMALVDRWQRAVTDSSL